MRSSNIINENSQALPSLTPTVTVTGQESHQDVTGCHLHQLEAQRRPRPEWPCSWGFQEKLLWPGAPTRQSSHHQGRRQVLEQMLTGDPAKTGRKRQQGCQVGGQPGGRHVPGRAEATPSQHSRHLPAAGPSPGAHWAARPNPCILGAARHYGLPQGLCTAPPQKQPGPFSGKWLVPTLPAAGHTQNTSTGHLREHVAPSPSWASVSPVVTRHFLFCPRGP